jgi:hypothetical protein
MEFEDFVGRRWKDRIRRTDREGRADDNERRGVGRERCE